MGGREPYTNGGIQADRVAETAKMFLSPSESNLVNADYLILDYSTITDKLLGITTWAGEPMEDYHTGLGFTSKYCNSLMSRLYYGEIVGQYELVYSSEQKIVGTPEVEVFRKRKIIDGQ